MNKFREVPFKENMYMYDRKSQEYPGINKPLDLKKSSKSYDQDVQQVPLDLVIKKAKMSPPETSQITYKEADLTFYYESVLGTFYLLI
jgi:hypothetical protein